MIGVNGPKLRFSEFSGEWEEKKLGQLTKFSKGKNISKDNITGEGTPCVRYGELYTTYKEKIKDPVSKTNLNSDELVFSEENDVIIPTSGETAIDIATVSCIMKDGVAIGGDTTIMKIKGNGLFYSYYLNSRRKKLARLAQGASVVHLYANHLKNFNLNIPSNPEQEKIASFLSKVDIKIEKLEKKQELWETYKKGIMQQIFSQKIRFKDENGEDYPDWEEKKLGEVAQFLDGKRIPLKSSERSKRNGPYPYYGASGIIDYVDDYIFDEELVLLGEDGANIINRSSRMAFLARGKYWVNNHAHVIKGLDDTNQYFLSEQLERVNYAQHNTGTAQPKLNQDVCKKIPLKMPKIYEQTKIANFLSAIDRKIELMRKKSEIEKKFKKGLLQQMFC